ncbi:MAG: zinc ribbon domain-containing protein, partial [Acidobacteriota bacterium]
FDAQRSAARREVQRAIEAVAKVRVERAAPGKRFRNIHVACLVERQATERVALPAWVLAYRYRGSPYRAIVHGQRADIVVGRAPVDWGKVARLVGVVAAVAAVIAAIVLAVR